jgi:hypothetical protein
MRPITIQFQGNPESVGRNDIMARIRDNKEAASINSHQVSLIGYETQVSTADSHVKYHVSESSRTTDNIDMNHGSCTKLFPTRRYKPTRLLISRVGFKERPQTVIGRFRTDGKVVSWRYK